MSQLVVVKGEDMDECGDIIERVVGQYEGTKLHEELCQVIQWLRIGGCNLSELLEEAHEALADQCENVYDGVGILLSECEYKGEDFDS